jgi:uncharacterized protein YqeY
LKIKEVIVREEIKENMKRALKAGDSLRVSVLRMLLSDIRNAEIKKKAGLGPDEIIKIVKTGIKRRRESIDLYLQGQRPELAEKEKKEIEILQSFLPPQLSEAEVEKVVRSAIESLGAVAVSDLGRVMQKVMAESGDRTEGKLVREVARRLLSADIIAGDG